MLVRRGQTKGAARASCSGVRIGEKNARATLAKIQKIFAENKGWASEQEMISDLAKFRRSRKKV